LKPQLPRWIAEKNEEVAEAQRSVEALKALQPLFATYRELTTAAVPAELAKVQRLQEEEQAAVDLQDAALANQVRALSVTQRALSVTQRALSVTQRALSVTQASS
jgi:formate dehydrogenase maturation protein FdhE